ncbi:hypothetical protein Ssi03_15560 [Sphaerisporangium siamense]|uniref:Uncharacterized protein n=1 Tax=Sphaerisporangium siamense TaxID=795645 RepID=A0A7W7DB11_9ACTN|nr:hypothetical protein [Sphaerisporangium siamense]MBB4702680.1 hypothetical protein [Sphaerisporangium siamense]GII83566.1 hypothetical protein Ssi03_15560 [Sphaerisporangium siamense]
MIIAVIVGLVAVVLLVLMVVALGMRSMNRRESNLPPERLRKMAEQAEDPTKAKRPGRPAEETFFESFPEGFDAFQEPERATARLRPGNGKPGARPAGRPGGRSAPRGKQSASSRGRRGVDEWGDSDDYDDDYWTRVRADDGAFGGTIAARMGASRPDLASPSSPPAAKPAAARDSAKPDEVDANAATVQAPLPPRPAGHAGQGDSPRAAAPSSAAAASDRTVTFPAPVPQPPAAGSPPAASAADVLGALGSPPAAPRSGRGSRPDPADPLGVDSSRTKPRRRGDAGDASRATPPARPADPRRSGRPGRPAEPGRSAPARPEVSRADSGRTPAPGRSNAPRPDAAPSDRADSGRTATGPLGTGRQGRSDAPRPADPLSDPLSGNPLTTGPMPGGAFPAGSIAGDPLSSGPLPSGATRPRSGEDSRRRPQDDAGRSPAQETPRTGSEQTGPFASSPSYGRTPDPLGTGAPGAAAGSWPAQPAYPATGSYDILDGPATPPAGTPAAPSSDRKSADYQLPGHDRYAARESYPSEPAYPAGPSAQSYEVRPGWATIDDSDAVTGSTPAPRRDTSAYDATVAHELPRRDDAPPSGSGQGYGGYGPGYPTGSAATPSSPVSSSWSQPRQNTGGSWPSYGELYGNGGPGEDPAQQKGSPSRGGHRRPAETDYPDYYR